MKKIIPTIVFGLFSILHFYGTEAIAADLSSPTIRAGECGQALDRLGYKLIKDEFKSNGKRSGEGVLSIWFARPRADSHDVAKVSLFGFQKWKKFVSPFSWSVDHILLKGAYKKKWIPDAVRAWLPQSGTNGKAVDELLAILAADQIHYSLIDVTFFPGYKELSTSGVVRDHELNTEAIIVRVSSETEANVIQAAYPTMHLFNVKAVVVNDRIREIVGADESLLESAEFNKRKLNEALLVDMRTWKRKERDLPWLRPVFVSIKGENTDVFTFLKAAEIAALSRSEDVERISSAGHY